MYAYAQTNIQLLNQLHQAGYSHVELQSVANAYKLAVRLFTGRFRPSGKTFIAHLVGTASILAKLQVPDRLIIVGLLHAVYSHGDFGTGQTGISTAKQKQILQVISPEIEEYIARYTALKWDLEIGTIVHRQIDTLDEIERDVLLIRLANELEERLDLGILYCGDAKYYRYTERDRHLPEMAEKLGYSRLAAEFDTVLKELAEAELPEAICNPTKQEYSTLVTPNSCQRKLSVLFHQVTARRIHYLKTLAAQLLQLARIGEAKPPNSGSESKNQKVKTLP
ncbi:DUF6817 domain-containing protein [Chamaesiphon polymorphus]|uniref:DUF6817 domain-containing protein n=1 Tax=Chamaesiphon polymorphus CCALA 037 TaxID=2107692 RepID=A0A2T1GM79_9CYAN|nr:HD domain-containing protein [Chamaesiphon polymorphus]PSB58981.1 hypothetical protein C7B77_02755 [Chamaesiphon polymorphus CCALA 037]